MHPYLVYLKENQEKAEIENEFKPFEKPPIVSDIDMKDEDPSVIKKDISKEKVIKYEPKIAAQAVRTMMKRDE